MSAIRRLHTDILVIGGGAAGMAAASGAAGGGVSVLLADERSEAGGILPQCIHHGFGLGRYEQDLTGPEYCDKERRILMESGACYMPRASVTELRSDRTAMIISPGGVIECSFTFCILAAGCRERSLYSLDVAGTRPEGVYTAGEVQEMMNLGHYEAGDRAFILGSGDIGQIVARRLIMTGKTVIAIAEISDHVGGMKRNRIECIEAYGIPVILNSTVTEVHGHPHITAVTLHHSDTGEDEIIPCDTLITALGLIPDTSLASSLSKDGSYPEWLYLSGNADHVHEIVDSVSAEAFSLGQSLAAEIMDQRT